MKGAFLFGVLLYLTTLMQAAAQDLTAILEPGALVDIRPGVSGILRDVAVSEGDSIQAGSLLAQIDDRSQAKRLALAQAVAKADGQIRRADAQIAQARSLLARMQNARSRGAAQAWEVAQAEQALALAEADKRIALDGQTRAQAQVDLEQAILDTYRLHAPFSGVILEIAETVGANVDPQSVVLSLAQLDELEATAFVPLSWVETLSPGDRIGATVEASTIEMADVVVASIDPRIDPASQTVRIRVTLENAQGRFRPGATLRLSAP
ncbi:MAG: efflux RND transporter periplasmic adaptor subunit [Pseudomonadota bacterium]